MYAYQIKGDVKQILGYNDDEKALSRLSDAVDALSNEGDWNPLIGMVDINSLEDGQTVTLPVEVDKPLFVNLDGKPAYGRNQWAEFHINGAGADGVKDGVPWHFDERGKYPVYMDILSPSRLIAVADLQGDLNKLFRVFGYDENNEWLRSQLANGDWIDGIDIPLNLIGDFPNEVINPDDERIFKRDFTTQTMKDFLSAVDHQLVTGAAVILNLKTAPIPVPFVDGTTYYVRVSDSKTVTLHQTRAGALANTGIIAMTSLDSTSEVTITDKRQMRVLTKFNSVAAHNIKNGTIISFTGTTVPPPLAEATEYFARIIDDNNFTAHATLEDAVNNSDAIDVTEAGAGLKVQAKQDIKPITLLTYPVNHNYLQGDIITVNNSVGSLPAPLLSGINYYVRYVSASKITIHSSLADATSGENPIVLTNTGIGASVTIKRIAAAANVGNQNQITAIGHNLKAGDLVQFDTDGTLPTPVTQNTTYKVATPLSADTFTLHDTADTPVDITGLGGGQLYLLISRVFGVGFTGEWSTDAEALVTGREVTLETTGSLPATSPAIDTVTSYYLRKIDDTRIQLFDNATDAADTSVQSTIERERTSGVATLRVDGHGLTTGDYLDISLVANTLDGVLNGVTVTAGGAGWVDGETVTMTNPGGSQATGIITVAAGAITDITVTDGGAQFTAAEALTLSGGSGAGGTYSVASVLDSQDNSDSSYNGDRIQITVTDPDHFTYAAAGLDEPTIADAGGQIRIAKIKVNSLGAGTHNLVLETDITAQVYSTQPATIVQIADAEYLQDDATIQLETDGTLPSPLAVSTDYKIKLEDAENGLVSFYTTGGAPITLTAIGENVHYVVNAKDFSPVIPTDFYCRNNNYKTGDEIVVSSSDTPPSPLLDSGTYYLRRIDADTVEIYSSKNQAENTLSTTGRIVATDTGTGVHQFLQTLPNWYVSKVERVRKDRTDGIIELYAWDYGRDEALTQVGYYQSFEENPQYSRITLGYKADWVRVKYRKKSHVIYSWNDYINLESKLAILFALRAIEQYRKDFSSQGDKYMQTALKFMSSKQDADTRGRVGKFAVNSKISMNSSNSLRNMM